MYVDKNNDVLNREFLMNINLNILYINCCKVVLMHTKNVFQRK